MNKSTSQNEQMGNALAPPGEGAKFPSVSNNTEKYFNYKDQMDRLKKARAEGFYLESIFIIYAMLEDRLSAFLYYTGVSNNTRDRLTSTKAVRPQLDQVLCVGNKPNFSLNKVSTKSKLIKELLLWSDAYEAKDNSKEYLDILCNQVNRAGRKAEVVAILAGIEAWCKARNELVHALLNKKLDGQEETLKQLVEAGLQYSRKLENFVRSFKVRNHIREEFDIE